MRYTGIQPQYFPRLHYFARILNTDIFVMRDDAQYLTKHKYPDGKTGKSYQSHTPIKTQQGLFLLTVPVHHGGFQSIVEKKVEYDQTWVDSQLKTLEFSYKKALNFKTLYPQLKQLLTHIYTSVAELNTATILWGILCLLDIPFTSLDQLTIKNIEKLLHGKKYFRLKNIKQASELAQKGKFTDLLKNEKILALIKSVGATEDYCGGTAVDAYMDEEIFAKNTIKITVQNWKYAEYPQLFGKQHGFIPNLSIIDLLMNTTSSQSRQLLHSDE